MKSIVIDKKGKSEEELMQCIEKLEKKYNSEISDYNIKINKKGSTYVLHAEIKKFLLNFKIDANLIVKNGSITLEYDSNIPAGYEESAIKMIEKELNSECA